MTTLGVAVSLGLIRTSVVVVATLGARVSIPRRSAADRATVGVVGMACILVVTGLTLVPLPGLWSHMNGLAVDSQEFSRQENIHDGLKVSAKDTAVALPSSPEIAERTLTASAHLPLEWLRRMGGHLQRATAAADASPRGWRRFVLAILLGGSGVSLLRLLLATRSVQRLRLASLPIADESINDAVGELKRRCGCRRQIELRETDQLMSAATSGWLRPVILLPMDWSQWSADELAAVLAHEVSHVRRADYLHRLIALLGGAIHFYHPLVRAAGRRLAADQEFAADQLARGLLDDSQSYARGLARLALRYHESLQDQRAWSSVSVMPRSSDFLARRLEMLRVKNDSTGKRVGRLLTCGVSACLVAIALATALLRSATAGDEDAVKSSQRPVEMARRQSYSAGNPATSSNPGQSLFGREAFDPEMIRMGQRGGFLIRVGDFLRHPEVQPHVGELNKTLLDGLRQLTKGPDCAFDLRDIEWIAGDLLVSVKAPDERDDKAKFMFGTGGMVIHMARAADWQEIIHKYVSASSLESYQGMSYLQLPMIPALGTAPPCMRFPDDRTIIVRMALRGDKANADTKDKDLRTFFDDTPNSYAWSDAWRAADGGLVTLLFDNSKVGWLDLPQNKKDYSEFVAPLIEKTKYLAVGWDWTDDSNRTGLQVRGTCDDHDSVKEVHLAAMTLLSHWPEMFLEDGDALVKYHKRILQFFSSVRVHPSTAGAEDHFVHATADVGWNAQEFIEILRQAWGCCF